MALFRWINGWPAEWAPAMRILSEAHTQWWFRLGLLALVIGLSLRAGNGRRAANQALLAFPIANAICDLFKKGLNDPRPCAVLPDAVQWIRCGSPEGTASSHAANMAAVAAVFWINLGPRWGGPWAVLALLVGVSRVYVSAHFPHQVLLGWGVGAAVGAAVAIGWRRFREGSAPPRGGGPRPALRDPLRLDPSVPPEPGERSLP